MKKYDIITIGGATEDITFFTKEGVIINNEDDILRQKLLAFEYGAKINVQGFESNFGGGAANTAITFANLGFKTASIIAVGEGHRGRIIIKNLKYRGVNTKLIQIKKGESSGVSFVLLCQNDERIIFSNRGANSKLSINEKEEKELKNSKWAFISSMSGNWKKDIQKIFSVKDLNIAWNPGHAQLTSGIKEIGKYLKNTKVLILNKDEAIELVMSSPKYKKMKNGFLNNIENLATALKEWVGGIVVITNGQEGAHAFDGDKIYKQDIIKQKKAVDKTGVGDAFGSAFVSGLEIYKGDIKKSLYLAARNSSAVLRKAGAQNGLLTKKEI